MTYLPVLLLLAALTLHAQTQTHVLPFRWQVDTLIVVPNAGYHYTLPQRHRPQKQSLKIFKNGLLLFEQADYRWQGRNISFFTSLQKGDSLRIRYRRLPFDLPDSFRLYATDTLSTSAKEIASLKKKKKLRLKKIRFENPFAHKYRGLHTNGSIMRGIQIGSNRDMTLNSGLNLELSGKLTDNLEIVAALTDEATPIQPEGNTKTLQEIDKVFVKFKSPYVQGTVGDFNLKYKELSFARLNRKLQGITLQGRYGGHRLGATIATTRGYFNHVQFLGQEGNQGPFQLTGKNGEIEIVVLAGTEKVWLDGKLMTRGESNDYVIEYGNGQIRFTTNRLITGSSRIEVDFEYFPAVQKYNRNVYSVVGGGTLGHKNLNYKFALYREADDPDQPLEAGGQLSAEEKAALKAAGDDPLKAFVPGASEQAAGKGSYMAKDTLFNGASYSIYEYVGAGNGNYSVVFSFVGAGQGDYQRDRLGVYRWAGPQAGSYRPIKLLPLPSSHDLASAQLEWRPSKRVQLQSEYAVSRRDGNTLSALDDGDNQGGALRMHGKISSMPLHWRGASLGQFNLDFNLRYVNQRFRAADRIRVADFQRYWNILPDAQTATDEFSFQALGDYRPMKRFKLDFSAGRLKQGGQESQRYAGSLLYGDSTSFYSKAHFEEITSKLPARQIVNNWRRYSGQISQSLWKFRPDLLYRGEWRKNEEQGRISGFRYDDLGARLNLLKWKYMDGFVQMNRRFDLVYDVQRAGGLIPQAVTTTQQLILRLLNVSQTSATLKFIHRKKDFTSRFENIKIDTLKLLYSDASVQDTSWQDRTTDMAELNIGHTRWKKSLKFSWQYRVASQQTALKEKVYIDVGQGRGNLRYDEDLKEYVPDADGNYLLFILPSGRFEPVTNLQTAWHIRWDAYRYWKKRKGARKWLRHLSAETSVRIEEETREKNVQSIYLLDLSKFQGAQTVRGRQQLNQDLYVLRHNRKLSFRLRYRYQRTQSNQFLSADENQSLRNREFNWRTDWRITPKLRSRTQLGVKQMLRRIVSNPLRNRDIQGQYVQQDVSYRPWQRWEGGIESQYGREENRVQNYPLSLWFAVLRARLNYSIAGKGRASAQYQYQTVRLMDNPLNLAVPYEMAMGKKEGVSQNWQLRIEYTVAKNIVFSFFYNGRRDAGFEQTIHTGQAELRAYF